MESMPDVLDISSDEELGLEEGPKRVDYNWIKEFLGVSDKESDDSDDVIVVHEQKPEPKSKSSRPPSIESDDDCVVLDFDPENAITSVGKSATESDELIVVGEKGQIACRDYPHPRHHCATFPFSSTPHERHCEKCHCFVCDLPAPCPNWGTGISSTDHCHATEKVEMWKFQRNFNLKKSAPLPASTNNGNRNSLPVEHSQQNQVVPLGNSQLSMNSISQIQASRLTTMRTCSSTHPIPQNNEQCSPIIRVCSSSLNSTVQIQASRANTIPICSSTNNFMVPNGTNHGRCQESASTFTRNRYLPSIVSRSGLGVRNNPFQRDRRRGSSNLRPQYSHRLLVSSGLGNAGGTLPVNHSAHDSSGYSNHVDPAVRCNKYYDSPGLSDYTTCNRWNNDLLPANLSSCLHVSAANSLTYNAENAVDSEIQAYNQPPPLENSQSFYQSCDQGNDDPSNDVTCLISNLHGNGQQIGSQMENASGDITQWGNLNQDSCQQEPVGDNRGETAPKAVYPFVDLVRNENSSQSIEPQNENPQPPIMGSTDQPPNMNDSSSLFAGSGYLADFEDWLTEKDNALPSELNILSPDPVPGDMGALFCDFEASWNGLAHA